MERNKIVVFRLYSGEHIIGSVKPDASGLAEFTAENPRTLSIVPSATGQVGLGFRQLGMFGDSFNKEVSLNPDQVMFRTGESELPKELIDGYLSEISGIEIASAASVPDLMGNPKAGNFSL